MSSLNSDTIIFTIFTIRCRPVRHYWRYIEDYSLRYEQDNQDPTQGGVGGKWNWERNKEKSWTEDPPEDATGEIRREQEWTKNKPHPTRPTNPTH